MIGPGHRRTMTEKYAEGTLDLMHVHYFCADCQSPAPDRTIPAVGDVSYRDLEELIALASRMLKEQMRDSVKCPTCGKEAKPRAADYHAFTGGRDLVVRLPAPAGWLRRTGPVELHWWDGEAFTPAAPTADERKRF